jgi:hypothetical protein
MNEDRRIAVLREGVELDPAGLRLQTRTDADALLRDVDPDLSFRYWFDIVEALPGTETLSNYRWAALPAAEPLLRRFGLPSTFPAILRASRAPLRLYFAGDFADNQLARGPYWLAGWPRLLRKLTHDDRDAGAATFYWSFYVPLMRALLSDGR